MSFDPSTILFNRFMGARFWFILLLASNFFWAIFNLKMTDKLKQETKIAVLDDFGNIMSIKAEHYDKAKILKERSAKNATYALLSLSPSGYDRPSELKNHFLPAAFKKTQEEWEKLQDEFGKRKIHQKVEIKTFESKRTSSGKGFLAKITGQLILTGSYEFEKFAASRTFEIVYTFSRNTNLLNNSYAPYAVTKYSTKYSKLKFDGESKQTAVIEETKNEK